MLTLLIITFAVLLAAAYTDLRTLEVPDWLNYAGIAAGLGIHAIIAADTWTIWPIMSSALGLLAGFLIACLMFYTGQWGGGDAKLLMAVGSLLGVEFDKFALSTSFIINLVFIGGAWVFAYAIFLAVKNRKRMFSTYRAIARHTPYKRLRKSTILTTLCLIIASFIFTETRSQILLLAALCYLLGFLTLFMKTIELAALHQWVSPEKLTEGDWIVHAIQIGKIKLDPPRLGLEKNDLKQIQNWHKAKKIDKVLVRYGVPFTPAFLLAFIASLTIGNIVLAAMPLIF